MSDYNVPLDFEKPRFISREQVEYIEKSFWSPCYIYSEQELEDRAEEFLKFPSAYWHEVEYAMKASSNKNLIKLFANKWIGIDASSEYEVYRAISAGVDPKKISISAQELSTDLWKLLDTGVFFTATSLHQIEEVWKLRPKSKIWIRLNPWIWSADFMQINTWGWIASFGIWHEYISEVKELIEKYELEVVSIQIHIGSENTPESWVKSANIWLDFMRAFPSAIKMSLWGGFKMGIMPYEKTANLEEIWEAVKEKIEDFYQKTGRKIKLIVEPWKYLSINTCSFLWRVNDVVDTGEYWYQFIKTNTWMNDMPRVAMYGIQEPIYILNDEKEKEKYVVVGHCCESADILTSELYDQEKVEPRELNKANIGDLFIVDGVWAYNASMSMKHYNSFPESAELLLRKDGSIVEIRKRQKIEDIWENEIEVI